MAATDMLTERILLEVVTYECLVLAFFFITLAGMEALLGVLLRDADDSGDETSVRGDTAPFESSLLLAPFAISCTGGTMRFWCALEVAGRSGRTWLSTEGASRLTFCSNFCFFAWNLRSFSSFPASMDERLTEPFVSGGAVSIAEAAADAENCDGFSGGISSSMEVSDDKDEELETLDVRGFVVGGGSDGVWAELATLCVDFLGGLSEILGFRGTACVSIEGCGIISGASEDTCLASLATSLFFSSLALILFLA